MDVLPFPIRNARYHLVTRTDRSPAVRMLEEFRLLNDYSNSAKLLDDRGIRVRIPAGIEVFLFSTTFRLSLGSTQSPRQRVPGAFSAGIKRLGRKLAIHSCLTSRLRMGGVRPALSLSLSLLRVHGLILIIGTNYRPNWVRVLMLLNCFKEISSSNIVRDTNYPDAVFSWDSSFRICVQCRQIGYDRFFRILSKS
jgi:hypothetical protein